MAMRRSKLSRNANQASSAVKTASALSSSAAPDAGMRDSPHMSSTGPSTPPLKTAPASQRQSPGARWARPARRSASSNASPIPEPR
jgi:hypothetical protein